MLMADDRSNLFVSEDFSFNDEDDLTIELETFMNILEETPETEQRNVENSASNDTTLDSRPGISDGSSESSVKSVVLNGVKLESSLLLGSPVQSFCGSLGDWMPNQDNKDKIPHHVASSSLQDYDVTEQRPNYDETFNFSGGDFNSLAINVGASQSDYLNQGTEFQFNGFEGDILSERFSNMQYVEENKPEVLGAPDMVSTAQNYMTMVNPAYSTSIFPHNFGGKPLPTSDEDMMSLRNEDRELLNEDRSSCNAMIHGAQVGDADRKTLESQMHFNLGVQGLNAHGYDSLSSSTSFSNSMGAFPNKQGFHIKDEKNAKLIAPWDLGNLLVDDVLGRKPLGDPCMPYFAEGSNQSYSSCWVPDSSENCNVLTEDEKDIIHDSKRLRLRMGEYDYTAFEKCSSVGHDYHFGLKAPPSVFLQGSRSKPQFVPTKVEREVRPNLPDVNVCHVANIRGKEFPKDSSSEQSNTDDDGDVCILEDISGPARMNISAVNGKPLVPQRTMIYNSFNSSRVGPIRHKANGERFVFQAALKDLCQPKSEDSPPDGVLAVPLLRHQRIALSWMVKKEKDVSRCSGGILADDQGLGKTVSTIALILKERSPPSSVEPNMAQTEPETLNLDEDEDEVSDVGKSNQGAQSCQGNGNFSDGKNISGQGKCRPAAGTLIVCPTSVLRQWAEELQNKVTKEANLSFLVYHGSNRTKNPSELAKFDVVLTTYAIVSMEVPKQPLADEDDDETKCASGSPMDFSSLKRRKYPPSAAKKPLKGKKGREDELPDPVARPLACVGWFRVVLDEAQSIKNHRTQVARACWGLRAKRRWCLSGTPIQNAVDDLYSYFRFLRFDPYSAYKSFCSGLKGPIQKSPANGYRKLQAVLKTVMLRRTKCTLLDGEPIIDLPAKTIKLKKVDFTEEERDFYCRLEADSRAQFAEYAAAGTVKQNYVNILLMLLRLRQACDHPLLVRKSGSSSIQRSSIEMAKKLPREKQIHLLNCLEASLAICRICSDPPEDAVATSCGHVFCNQCICEHLSGDDMHCPAANCKTHLRTSLLFSIATLRSSLSDEPTVENSSDCPSIEMGEGHEPFSSSRSYGSSKIKAVLEVLQSLSRQPDCTKESCSSSVDDVTSIAENNSALHSGASFENLHIDESAMDGVTSTSDSATAVGEKAIIFSQWTRMLDLLEDCLKTSSIQYRRLDGTMSVAARDKAVKDFNSLPEVSVMIMSLKAASLGLNMVAACHVILLDLWWNPTTEDQAIDRAHRIGQTRPVTVLRLTVKDTVEDRILALQQKKREMVASAFGEDENGSRQTRLTVEDLRYLFMDE